MSKVSNWNHLHSAGGTQQGHHNTRHDKKQAIFLWREQCTRGRTGSQQPRRSGPGRPGSAAGRRQQRRPAAPAPDRQQPGRWQIFTGPGWILAGNKINRLQPAQQQPGRERSRTTGRNAQPWKIKQQPGRAAEDPQQGGSSAGQQRAAPAASSRAAAGRAAEDPQQIRQQDGSTADRRRPGRTGSRAGPQGIRSQRHGRGPVTRAIIHTRGRAHTRVLYLAHPRTFVASETDPEKVLWQPQESHAAPVSPKFI